MIPGEYVWSKHLGCAAEFSERLKAAAAKRARVLPYAPTQVVWPKLAAPIRGIDNTAIAFWWSRHNMRQAPELTDLRALAIEIRSAY